MGLPKRLTEMQRRFAEFLVFGGPDGPCTKTEAATLAGYSKDKQSGTVFYAPEGKEGPVYKMVDGKFVKADI